MKKPIFILSFLSLLAFSACHKDEETLPEDSLPVIVENYLPLTVGNYWIYEEFQIDTNGTATDLGKIDSCYIEKDTLINNKTYFKYCRVAPGYGSSIKFIRDSSHYIVNSNGIILFSSVDFSSILHTYYTIIPVSDTVSVNTSKMTDKDVEITTPYGTFTTYNYKTTCAIAPAFASNGNERYWNTRYANNVGIVAETIATYLSTPVFTERRLVRYHLN